VIATLRGRLRRRLEDRVIVECGGIGYEVFLPPVAMKGLGSDDELELHIHYHATRDQPRPVLIGFVSELDKEFFERLITVKDIGPLVAARALAAPVAELAAAIARQDERYLRGLPGIGAQKAKNIVAQLQTKVSKFALAKEGAPVTSGDAREAPASRPSAASGDEGADTVRSMVWEVLVKQLGHRPSEASQLITDACARKPGVTTAEELFDEIYRGQRR
jgi:holliday junction DNA helicase RuvA